MRLLRAPLVLAALAAGVGEGLAATSVCVAVLATTAVLVPDVTQAPLDGADG